MAEFVAIMAKACVKLW